jgi:hypothetical protein
MKVFLVLLISVFSQIALADIVITGSNLEAYKTAAILNLRHSSFRSCSGINWNFIDGVAVANSLVVVDGTSKNSRGLLFVQTTSSRYMETYLRTDSTYNTIRSVQVRSYMLRDVNMGTLKDPKIVKGYVLDKSCKKNS